MTKQEVMYGIILYQVIIETHNVPEHLKPQIWTLLTGKRKDN